MKSITNEIVEYFPKAMLFYSIAVSFCAFRSPSDNAVVLAYFVIPLRVL